MDVVMRLRTRKYCLSRRLWIRIVDCQIIIACLFVGAVVQAQMVLPPELQVLQGRDPGRQAYRAVSATGLATEDRLNINTATADELAESLPGIGPEKARRIVEWRTVNGAFQSIEQLLEVKGIGVKTLEQIRHRLRIDEARAAVTDRSANPVIRTAIRSSEEQSAFLAVQRIVAQARQDAALAYASEK